MASAAATPVVPRPGSPRRQLRPARLLQRAAALLLALAFVAWHGGSAVCAVEVIRVKVVVDEEERTPPPVWQRRLRERIDAAAAIINQYANIRFTVAEMGTWQSDNRVQDLNKSLRELEQEIEPTPCDIVIAFSSQYRFQKGVNGLGGTRGPLHTHILLRETAPNAFEPERLEALVHEMGHFLGAAHSKAPESAMRPIIGDGRARIPTYRIGFDQQNSQIIRLVAAEISALHIRRFQQLSKATRDRMMQHYQQLAEELPRDPAAPRFLEMLKKMEGLGPAASGPTVPGAPLVPRPLVVPAPPAGPAGTRIPFPSPPTLSPPQPPPVRTNAPAAIPSRPLPPSTPTGRP